MTNISLKKNSILLAPMAGVTDSGFRTVCRKYGADAVFSEMISAKAMSYNDRKTLALLSYDNCESPISIQIFGNDIECMKHASDYINKHFDPMSIDINMGCPAPKIFSNGDGCALMADIDKAYTIIEAVKSNSDIPVSVKFRSGIDSAHINAIEFAKMCESAKADFITVHARTREQFYSGKSDMNLIKGIVESVSIPVIANGDIVDGESAKNMLNYTGAYCIMIGRSALGNPMIFNTVKRYLGILKESESANIFDIALEHLSLEIQKKGEIVAVKEFRKHLIWYLKGTKNASKLKQMSSSVNTYSECKHILDLAKKKDKEY